MCLCDCVCSYLNGLKSTNHSSLLRQRQQQQRQQWQDTSITILLWFDFSLIFISTVRVASILHVFAHLCVCACCVGGVVGYHRTGHAERLNFRRFSNWQKWTDSISKCEFRVKTAWTVCVRVCILDSCFESRWHRCDAHAHHTSRCAPCSACMCLCVNGSLAICVVATISLFPIEINMSTHIHTVQHFRK